MDMSKWWRNERNHLRVGHIGYLQKSDYDKLIAAFINLREKKFI